MGSPSYVALMAVFVLIVLLWVIRIVGLRRALSFIGRLLQGIARNWFTTLGIVLFLVVITLMIIFPTLRDTLRDALHAK